MSTVKSECDLVDLKETALVARIWFPLCFLEFFQAHHLRGTAVRPPAVGSLFFRAIFRLHSGNETSTVECGSDLFVRVGCSSTVLS
jgi:hypothetical protein